VKLTPTDKTAMREGVAFDRTRPEAASWASRQAGQLIVEVTEETRRAVRLIISRAFAEGIPPRSAVRLLRQARGLGLTAGQALRWYMPGTGSRRLPGAR